MRKLITVLASVAMVVALGAPAFADGAKSHSPSTNQVTTMRVDHHGHGGDGWHEGRRGHDGRRGYDRDGYYRHHGYYDRYYYDGYYDGYDGGRCRWAYYHDRYWFDRYCGGYYYGY
ncbi:MAG: hypothetical protein LC792_24630 [Actinobacteria bacterium]|nr:hypothetical protein [Actinomycetota bacterium]